MKIGYRHLYKRKMLNLGMQVEKPTIKKQVYVQTNISTADMIFSRYRGVIRD